MHPMTEQRISLVLVEKEIVSHAGPVDSGDDYSTPPSTDSNKDRELLSDIERFAAVGHIQQAAETKKESHHHVSDGRRQYWGGSLSISETAHIITYTAVAIAGFAAFIDHVLSSAIHWKELRKDRSIKIDVNGMPVYIPDGATALEVMSKIQEALQKHDAAQ